MCSLGVGRCNTTADACAPGGMAGNEEPHLLSLFPISPTEARLGFQPVTEDLLRHETRAVRSTSCQKAESAKSLVFRFLK